MAITMIDGLPVPPSLVTASVTLKPKRLYWVLQVPKPQWYRPFARRRWMLGEREMYVELLPND